MEEREWFCHAVFTPGVVDGFCVKPVVEVFISWRYRTSSVLCQIRIGLSLRNCRNFLNFLLIRKTEAWFRHLSLVTVSFLMESKPQQTGIGLLIRQGEVATTSGSTSAFRK